MENRGAEKQPQGWGSKAVGFCILLTAILMIWVVLPSVARLGNSPLDQAIRNVRDEGKPVVVLSLQDFFVKAQFFNIPGISRDEAGVLAQDWLVTQGFAAKEVEDASWGARHQIFQPGIRESERIYDLASLLKLAQDAEPSAELVVLAKTSYLAVPGSKTSSGFISVQENRFAQFRQGQAEARHESRADPFLLVTQLAILGIGALIGGFGLLRLQSAVARVDLPLADRRRLAWRRDLGSYPALMLFALSPGASTSGIIEQSIGKAWFGSDFIQIAAMIGLAVVFAFVLLQWRSRVSAPLLQEGGLEDDAGKPISALLIKRTGGVTVALFLCMIAGLSQLPFVILTLGNRQAASPMLFAITLSLVLMPGLAAFLHAKSRAQAEIRQEAADATAELPSAIEGLELPANLGVKLMTGTPLAYASVVRRGDSIYVLPDAILRMPREELHFWIFRASLPSNLWTLNRALVAYLPMILALGGFVAAFVWTFGQRLDLSRPAWMIFAPLIGVALWMLLSFTPVMRRLMQREIKIDEEAAMLFPQPGVVLDAYRRNVATVRNHPLTQDGDLSQLLRLDAVRAKLLTD